MRLTFVLFQMSQLRAAKRVCKNPGTKAYFLTKSVNDVDRREWLYRDGAARKVLGDRDFVFGDELTRENLLKIAVTAAEIREVNVYKVCVQPLNDSEFTVHVDVAACRISDLKSQGGSPVIIITGLPPGYPQQQQQQRHNSNNSNKSATIATTENIAD